MGLFKSGKSKADDLLSILIPSLEWQMREELKKRLAVQMEDVVNEVARQVIGYGYDEAIKELTVKVRAPKREWVGLTDEEKTEIFMQAEFNDLTERQMYDVVEAKLKEKNGAL
jgi:hypothetical protein